METTDQVGIRGRPSKSYEKRGGIGQRSSARPRESSISDHRLVLVVITRDVADSDRPFYRSSLHHGTDMYRAVVACCRTLCPRDLVDDSSVFRVFQSSTRSTTSCSVTGVPLCIDQPISDLRPVRIFRGWVYVDDVTDTIWDLVIDLVSGGHPPPLCAGASGHEIMIFIAAI